MQILRALEQSPVTQRWNDEQLPTVAVVPIPSALDDPESECGLDELGASIETFLVHDGRVRVVDAAGPPSPADTIRAAPSARLDSARTAQWGLRIGARYVLIVDLCQSNDTATVNPHDLVMQVVDSDSGEVQFNHEAHVPGIDPGP